MPKTDKLPLERLLLDPNNYRIRNDRLYRPVNEGDYAQPDVQLRTLSIVSGEKDGNIQDLVGSFEHNGFLPIDQIQVRPYGSGGRYLVVEGNRRVTALKRMQASYRSVGAPLGKLDPSVFEAVPVVIFDVADNTEAMVLMGLKHISGNLKWSDYNQALYVYDLYTKQKLSKDDICDKIAVSKVSVGMNLRALAFVEQYKESDYGDQFTEAKFALFREIVRNRQLKEWIGWNEDRARAENQDHVAVLFSLISNDVTVDDASGEEIKVEPVITKRDELRQLSEMVGDSVAVGYLIRTRNLAAAYSRSVAVASDQIANRLETLDADVKGLKAFRIDANGLSRLSAIRDVLTEVLVDNEIAMVPTEKREQYLCSPECGVVIDSVKITEYKGFRGFCLNGLASVNVIAGANNTGKTTLLEAIYLLVKQSDVRSCFHLADKRGKMSSSRDGYAWSVKQIPVFSISGKCVGRDVSVELEISEDEASKDRNYLMTMNLFATCGEIRQASSNRVYLGFVDRDEMMVKSICPAIFNTPFYNNEQANYRRYYLYCQETKIVDRILQFVRENVSPSVESIYWDDEDRRFKVTDARLPKAVDLSQYGEGMQRVFLLALLFASASNGILLVDEIENAIHPKLLVAFTELVDALSREFNVQVFATTHSKECIDGFVSVCRKNEAERFSFIGLVGTDSGERVARVYSGERYVKASDLADVDLRGVL